MSSSSHYVESAGLDDLPRAVDALEEEVLAWMQSPLAWNERNHATIIQFLSDIRAHVSAVCGTGGVSPKILNLELDRLNKKVRDAVVGRRIDELRHILTVTSAGSARSSTLSASGVDDPP